MYILNIQKLSSSQKELDLRVFFFSSDFKIPHRARRLGIMQYYRDILQHSPKFSPTESLIYAFSPAESLWRDLDTKCPKSRDNACHLPFFHFPFLHFPPQPVPFPHAHHLSRKYMPWKSYQYTNEPVANTHSMHKQHRS
jgi:hypothetical protein